MNNGDTVSIQCTISGGDLPVQVSWTLNGSPLEPYQEIVTQKQGKRINSLMIDSVSDMHAGNYTCIAENAAGIAQHSAELMVIGTPPFNHSPFTNTLHPYPSASLPSSPFPLTQYHRASCPSVSATNRPASATRPASSAR